MRSPCIAAFEPVSSGCGPAEVAFRQQAIGAGRRQPFEGRQIFTSELDAVRLIFEATLVVTALAGFDIELTAGDVGEVDLIGIFIHQLMQAALAAAVTQRFPLSVGHVIRGFCCQKGCSLIGMSVVAS